MSLGPVLHFDGYALMRTPWGIFNELPIINQALPGRFGMYLFFIAGVVASLYFANTKMAPWLTLLLAGSCLLFIAPRLSTIQSVGIDTPDFFHSDTYRDYLVKGDNVLILPMGMKSKSLLWQAQTDFSFGLATGRLGQVAPPEFVRWPVLLAFEADEEIIDFPEQLDAFLGAHQVKAIVVDPREPGPWRALLEKAGMKPIPAGGILFYRVPLTVLASFRNSNAHQMAEKEAEISFAALISAAARYVNGGFPLMKLTPREAQRLGLLNLPPGNDARANSPPTQWWQKLWLGAWSPLMVGVGVLGDYKDLRPLVQRYGPDAADVFFPFPAKLADEPQQGSGQLLMVFTPEGLQHAASEHSGG
jgi:hypothetical protein